MSCFRVHSPTIAAFVRQHLVMKLGITIVASLLAAAAVLVLHVVAAPMHHDLSSVAVAQEATCGDGVLDPGEQCDDDNTQAGDCCSSTCHFEDAGSLCRDGDACTDPDACDGHGGCTPGEPVICPAPDQCFRATGCDSNIGCGYSQQPDTTPCDDGIACSFDDQCVGGVCLGTVPTCGDGVVETQEGCEQCDDANAENRDGCNASCRLEARGAYCQALIGRAGTWLFRRIVFIQRCRDALNAGNPVYLDRKRTQPITDPADCVNAFGTARGNVPAARTVNRWSCDDTIVSGLGVCAKTVDGLVTADGSGCLVDAFATATEAMTEQEYGQMTAGDSALQKCQRAIAFIAGRYARNALVTIEACRNALDQNEKRYFDKERTLRLVDPADCASEYRTHARLLALGQHAHGYIAGDEDNPRRCTDDQVNSLGLCASTIDGLVSPDGSGGCLITGHLAQVNALINASY